MPMTVRKSQGLYPTFERKGGPFLRASHYCPGCGHGILHKLIGEALADFDLQDRAIFISPVGCAVFGYYYFDCGNVQAAHGRACAVATGLQRALPGSVIISYQGDGDLASIGFNQTFQAANRGEKIVVFFVNHAVYGMTGCQLAPTTLVGQKTVTSPWGRDATTAGYPIHVCEILNTIPAPVYLERCSVADAPRIQKARRAIRHALEIQRDGLGFAMVEFLSPCPTNSHGNTAAANAFVRDELEKEFPLGCFRDQVKTAPATPPPAAIPIPVESLEHIFGGEGIHAPDPKPDPSFRETRIKFAGHGGQGILRSGVLLAEAGQNVGRFVSWLPSYGPEQRGGTANCSVVVSGQPVGTPLVTATDVLVALNQSSLERFAPDVRPNGLILAEQQTCPKLECCGGVRVRHVPALALATEAGNSLSANTVMLGVLAASGALGIPEAAVAAAVHAGFAGKAKVQDVNDRAFAAATAWYRSQPAA